MDFRKRCCVEAPGEPWIRHPRDSFFGCSCEQGRRRRRAQTYVPRTCGRLGRGLYPGCSSGDRVGNQRAHRRRGVSKNARRSSRPANTRFYFGCDRPGFAEVDHEARIRRWEVGVPALAMAWEPCPPNAVRDREASIYRPAVRFPLPGFSRKILDSTNDGFCGGQPRMLARRMARKVGRRLYHKLCFDPR